jgi:hypothetical protein
MSCGELEVIIILSCQSDSMAGNGLQLIEGGDLTE